jgi:uncharacterized membrane protein
MGTGLSFHLDQLAGFGSYLLIAVTSVACIIGSIVGSHVTVKASPGFVKAAFAFIMWSFATQIALRLLGII